MENMRISELSPEKLGIKKYDNPKINVKDSKESLEMIRSAFAGKEVLHLIC